MPYEVGHAQFRAWPARRSPGRRSACSSSCSTARRCEILGIHCFGDQASEIIHIGQAIMTQAARNTLDYFVNTTFNYPTMAEAYRVAALNGLNRLF